MMVKKRRIFEKEETAAPEPANASAGYTIGSWHGHVQYRCTRCPYDVLDKVEKIKAHIEKHLNPTPEQAPVATEDVLTLPLVETDSFTDEVGVEHKKFTIKE
jgi:hypothetical protein